METRVSTGYDFVQNGVTYTQLRFERDLAGEWTSTGHLWNKCQLGFFIGIKSGVLSDIKWTNEVQIHRVNTLSLIN
jgi:hypothetical protein